METTTWQLLAQFGLAGIIFGGFLCVLRWVFTINGKLLQDMASERAEAHIIYHGFINQIETMNRASQEFQNRVHQDHDHNRDEHKELLQAIQRVHTQTKE